MHTITVTQIGRLQWRVVVTSHDPLGLAVSQMLTIVLSPSTRRRPARVGRGVTGAKTRAPRPSPRAPRARPGHRRLGRSASPLRGLSVRVSPDTCLFRALGSRRMAGPRPAIALCVACHRVSGPVTTSRSPQAWPDRPDQPSLRTQYFCRAPRPSRGRNFSARRAPCAPAPLPAPRPASQTHGVHGAPQIPGQDCECSPGPAVAHSSCGVEACDRPCRRGWEHCRTERPDHLCCGRDEAPTHIPFHLILARHQLYFSALLFPGSERHCMQQWQ